MDNYVETLKEGQKIDMNLLITNSVKGVSNAGSPYLSITFQDKTGSIDGKKWDANELDAVVAECGKVVRVVADVIEYRGVHQLKVLQISEVDQTQVDFVRFCIACPVPQETLLQKLHNYINGIKNEDCKTILNHILNKYYDRFIVYPAASKNHHCCLSGLLYHTISMADIAMMISSYYQTIDKDVLLTGVILHDVGKVMELSGPIATKYTIEGRLLGHISIMVGEIRIAAKEENISGEIPLLLEHMILSHHGNKDFGSPILPLTREAVVLHFVDDLDSKMNILDKAYDDVEEGEFTQRIIALDGRAFYKPKKNSF